MYRMTAKGPLGVAVALAGAMPADAARLRLSAAPQQALLHRDSAQANCDPVEAAKHAESVRAAGCLSQ